MLRHRRNKVAHRYPQRTRRAAPLLGRRKEEQLNSAYSGDQEPGLAGLPEPGPRDRATARRLAPAVQRVALTERPLVLRSLEVARAGRLTIIVAPPGYGKTTVLAQWRARLIAQGRKVAWYTAAATDAEPAAFLKMLTLALDAGGIDVGDAARRALGNVGAAAVLDALLLGLEQTTAPIALIIDDFETIDHAPITRVVEDLIQNLPEHIHLAIGTRKKPSLALAQLRAQGAVRLIEPDELKLSGAEIAQALDLPPDSPHLAPIAAQTEGWPVAVQLYRLWRERAEKRGDAPPFGGHAEEVADYLVERIFSALPVERQQAIIDVSVVDDAEAELIDEMRGGGGGGASQLHEAMLALPTLVQQSASDGGIAYRLHPLLAGYAQSRLALDPARRNRLQRRAAAWFWRNQRYADAIRQAVRSQSPAELRELLATLPFLEIFLALGADELRAILREIPGDCIEDMPRLQLATALAQFKAGFHAEAELMLARIGEKTQGFRTAGSVPVPGMELEALALQLMFTGQIDGCTVEYDGIVERLRGLARDRPQMWAWCENILLTVHQERGDFAAARRSLAQSRDTYRIGAPAHFAELYLQIHELLLDIGNGRLSLASERAQATLRRKSTHLPGEQSLHAMARISAALVDYERNFRANAADEMRVALDRFGVGDAWFDQYAIVIPVIVDVTLRRHGLAAARTEIDALRTRTRHQGLRSTEGFLRAVEIRCCVRGGDPDTAERLMTGYALTANHPRLPWRERDMALQTAAERELQRLHLDETDGTQALRLARQLREAGQRGDRLATWLRGQIAMALALEAMGRAEAADDALQEAVLLAYPEGFIAPFAEQGQALQPLLQRIGEREQAEIEQRHIVAALQAIRNGGQLSAPDALSDREAEIMVHLAEGASNKLIGRRLGLSDNTIKFHLKKIYAKFGVSSRKAAAAHFLRNR